jgi:V8-like Glu-specific endopeptidase
MAAADPLGLDAVGNLLAPRPAATGRTASRPGVVVPRSAGKLFFTTPQGDAVCSAAAVHTPQRDVIITAAHCAHTGPGGLLRPSRYFTNFLFVPRYTDGSAPDGRWVGVRAVTHRQWIEDENLAFDQALIEVAPRAGRNLVDVVGGNGLAWNYPARQAEVRVWGWPAEAPYNGETAQRCFGPTASFSGTRDAQIACPMTGGASGGPWFLSMINPNVGFIWAVTSRRTITGPKLLIARPLTSSITTLLSAAARASSPAVVRPASSRIAARPRIVLRAIPSTVGRGQLLRLRVRTTPGTRVVFRVPARSVGPHRGHAHQPGRHRGTATPSGDSGAPVLPRGHRTCRHRPGPGDRAPVPAALQPDPRHRGGHALHRSCRLRPAEGQSVTDARCRWGAPKSCPSA